MTGYGAVRRGADLRYGETVAVVATGGVGTNIVQIARAFGASQVIAIDVDDEKLAPMLDYGGHGRGQLRHPGRPRGGLPAHRRQGR